MIAVYESIRHANTGRARPFNEVAKEIAVLGCGKMGTILLESFLERKLIRPEEAVATVQHGDRSQGTLTRTWRRIGRH